MHVARTYIARSAEHYVYILRLNSCLLFNFMSKLDDFKFMHIDGIYFCLCICSLLMLLHDVRTLNIATHASTCFCVSRFDRDSNRALDEISPKVHTTFNEMLVAVPLSGKIYIILVWVSICWLCMCNSKGCCIRVTEKKQVERRLRLRSLRLPRLAIMAKQSFRGGKPRSSLWGQSNGYVLIALPWLSCLVLKFAHKSR
jgi:hypothetical protein